MAKKNKNTISSNTEEAKIIAETSPKTGYRIVLKVLVYLGVQDG